MSNYVRVLTPEQAEAEQDSSNGCLAGLICCGLAVMYYCEWVGPLDSPVKKIGAITCGVFAMIAGYALRTLIWAAIGLAILGFAGWHVVLWVME